MTLLSYHNDPQLKADIVAEMKIHQKQDDLIKGSYKQENGRFKGCAVGCGVQSLNVKKGLSIRHDDHLGYANALGIPEWLARLEDILFEGLEETESNSFPVRFLKAIPIGVDLEPVKWKFCAFILKEQIDLVLGLKIDVKLKEQVVNAIQDVLSLHVRAIKSGQWDEKAESAAESAAWSAGWSAGWSAAESAARSAAWSAARSAESAAYKRYTDYLIELLEKEARA